MVNLFIEIGILAAFFVLTVIGYALSTAWIYARERIGGGKYLNFKPFNCAPCSAFWTSLILSTVTMSVVRPLLLPVYSVTWSLLFFIGAGFALLLFMSVLYIENRSIYD